MSEVTAVTDATFKDEVLDSANLVLVDFWAPWCGPCRMVAPVVAEIAEMFIGKVKVVKLNTDENPNIASQYGIRSIPTLMIFKEGQKVDMVVGAVPKTTLARGIDTNNKNLSLTVEFPPEVSEPVINPKYVHVVMMNELMINIFNTHVDILE